MKRIPVVRKTASTGFRWRMRYWDKAGERAENIRVQKRYRFIRGSLRQACPYRINRSRRLRSLIRSYMGYL